MTRLALFIPAPLYIAVMLLVAILLLYTMITKYLVKRYRYLLPVSGTLSTGLVLAAINRFYMQYAPEKTQKLTNEIAVIAIIWIVLLVSTVVYMFIQGGKRGDFPKETVDYIMRLFKWLLIIGILALIPFAILFFVLK